MAGESEKLTNLPPNFQNQTGSHLTNGLYHRRSVKNSGGFFISINFLPSAYTTGSYIERQLILHGDALANAERMRPATIRTMREVLSGEPNVTEEMLPPDDAPTMYGQSLREKEKEIAHDVRDGIDGIKARKVTLNDMFEMYMAGKGELKDKSAIFPSMNEL